VYTGPLYTASGAYSRAEREAAGSPASISENYSASLGWRPVDLPTASFIFNRTNSFDENRLLRDATTDTFSFSSTYIPIRNIFLNYNATFGDFRNKLKDVETKSLTQSAGVTYSDLWWNRTSVSSRYTVNTTEFEIPRRGTGEVDVSITPLSGLSAINDNAVTGALSGSPVLIDGNFTLPSGIGLFRPSFADTKLRNVGLQFFGAMEVNTLLVWVDRDLASNADLQKFIWDIYVSDDNLTWKKWATVNQAPFGPFFTRFEIQFPAVKTQFIKAVTSPLFVPTPPPEVPDLHVTELQAILRKPAQDLDEKTTLTAQNFNASFTTKLLDYPSLSHNISYTLQKSSGNPSSYTIANGLFLSQGFRLSRILTAGALLSRNDNLQQNGARFTGYSYGASLTAVPLPTLTHNLSYSGSTGKTGDNSTSSDAIGLTNTAELYKGVTANLTAGANRTRGGPSGGQTETDTITGGLSLTPNRFLGMNVSYSQGRTKQSGGNLPEMNVNSRGYGFDFTFNPYYTGRTLYLAYSYYRAGDNLAGVRGPATKSYVANWSPFPDGTLHFNFNYNESYATDQFNGFGRSRSITPSIRWNISRNMFFNLSYGITSGEDNFSKSETKTLGGFFRVSI
jgi:hypothetical protein